MNNLNKFIVAGLIVVMLVALPMCHNQDSIFDIDQGPYRGPHCFKSGGKTLEVN